jgi:hypothetical protein
MEIAADLAVGLSRHHGLFRFVMPASRTLGAFTSFAATAPLLLAFDSLVNFFSMYGNTLWRVDAHPDLVPLNTQHGDRHVIADHHGLTDPSRQYQHFCVLLNWAAGSTEVRLSSCAPDAVGNATAPGALHDQPNDPD